METLLNYFTTGFEYASPHDRQRARGVRYLNVLTLLVIAGQFVYTVFAWNNIPAGMRSLVFLAIILIGVVALVHSAVNRGRLILAARLYVGVYLLIAGALVLATGEDHSTVLAMAIPLVIAGMLLDRQSVTTTIVLTVMLLFVIAAIQRYVTHILPSIFATAVPNTLVLVLIGLSQWYIAGELEDAFEETARAEQSLGATVELSKQLIAPKTPAMILRDFSARMQSTFDLQQVQIFLTDPNAPGRLVLRGGAGLSAQRALAEDRRLRISDDSPLAEAFRDREHRIVRTSSLGILHGELLPGSHAQVVIPIEAEDKLLGVVDYQSAREMDFPDPMVDLLTALTRQLGAMLENLRLHGDVSRYEEEQNQLFAQIETYLRDNQRLRQQVAGVVWDRFFQERGSSVIGFDVTDRDEEPIVNTSLSDTMTTTLRAGAVDVRKVDNGYLLVLPIVLRGQVLGAMEFEIEQRNELAPRVVDLATTIAERLSLALDNARLVQETQAQVYREQQIGLIADRLQGAGTIEDLLALAANEFNTAMGGARTHIRLQLPDQRPETAPSNNGGGAS